MSYAAERWARAQALRFSGEPEALALLKEIACWYLEKTGACEKTQGELAKLMGYKKADTVGRYVKKLVQMGYVTFERTHGPTGNITGSVFRLVGFVASEWPEKRQGMKSLLPADTTPYCGGAPYQGVPRIAGDPHDKEKGYPVTGGRVPRIAGDPHDKEKGYPVTGGRVPRIAGEGTPQHGIHIQGNTGNTGNNSNSIGASASQTLENTFEDVPFDESLYEEARSMGSEPNTVKAEAPKRRTTTPRKKPATRCPFGPDASIPPEYLEIAQKAGIGDPQQVFSAFVNHAIAHDRSLVVWPAGFRTWCSNELRYHPNQTPKPKPLHQRTAADYDW